MSDSELTIASVPTLAATPLHSMKGEIDMAQLPPWTQEVSERLIDLQIHTERMIDADGVRTDAELALIQEFKDAQAVIQDVEDEITGVFTTIRTGKRPRRMLRPMTHEEDPQAAA